MNTKQRRVAVLGIGGALAIAIIASAFAIANTSRSSTPHLRSSASPGGNSASTGGSSALLPATPLMSALASGAHTPVSSFALRIDPSRNATASGVTHYEVWRRDESLKSAQWQDVSNIPANLMSKGHVYTDLHEHPRHTYAFRVVAVSATTRSQYNEIHIVSQR